MPATLIESTEEAMVTVTSSSVLMTSTDLVSPSLLVTEIVEPDSSTLQVSAPVVAVSAAWMALFVLLAAVLAALIDAVRALRSISSSLPLSEGDIKPALPGDMKGLLAAVREVLAKGKSHYTDACRKKAVKDYNKDVQYGKYIELYNKIVKH